MGNIILGKRSRNYYKGFNDRQINYIKQKFDIISKTTKNQKNLDKAKFMEQYKLSKEIVDSFYKFVDFDESSQIDQYEFICAVHTFCNMTVSELGSQFFEMITNNKSMSEKQLKSFTQVCLKYNCSLQNKPIEDKQITKINKDKFKKYDFDKSNSIQKQQFIKICTKDQDYKKWLYNMGFITKNQMKFQDQIYDLIDSDLEGEVERHLAKTNPNVDKIKRGIEHRINDDDFEVVEEQGVQSLPQKGKQSKKEQKPIKKQPWQDYISKCQPNKTAMQKQNRNSPSQSLTMTYVFGYRSYDCRNNIKFDSRGNVVYHQGSLGIVMNQKSEQRYINEHKDDITCLDVVENLVVTGEVGSVPSVILWNTDPEKDSVNSIKSDLIVTSNLKQSVGNVALTRTKSYLAVNCNDSDHELVIYKIEQTKTKGSISLDAKVKAFGPLSKNTIFDLKFTTDQKMVVAATLKQILFVKYDNGVLNGSRGQFNEFSNSSALCLLPLQATLQKKSKSLMISGMTNGSIYFWDEDKCIKALSGGHNGSISALALIKKAKSQTFVSGDKTGKIIVWNDKFQIENKCTIQKNNSLSNMIVSLSIYKQNQILVGTKASKVYRAKLVNQLILRKDQAIINGHCQGNLWALAVDQSVDNNIFYTGGQDQRLMKWSYGDTAKLNKLIMQQKCPFKIRSISHNKEINMLAVGYQNGLIQIFDQNLKPLNIKFNSIKNPDQEVLNLVKFSTLGNYLLASYFYNKQNQIKIFLFDKKGFGKQIYVKLTSKCKAADFQQNCHFIRVNTQKNQFKVFDIREGKVKQIQAKEYNSFEQKFFVTKAKWQTHTTILSPETKGFKLQGVQESDIICCDRSRCGGNVILIGDKYSKIKLFNYPLINYPIFNKYEGHSNLVTGIQFHPHTKNDDYAISIGGEEKSIIVWKYDPDLINNQKFFQMNEKQNNKQQGSDELQKAKGQQSMSTNQYKGQIIPPIDYKNKYNIKRDNKLPKQQLKIQHVFGIRNQYIKDEVRNMCKFSKDFGHILFPTACLGVKMNIKDKSQTFFQEHKQDIVSFALDSSRSIMATGQMAEKNTNDPRKKIVSICVWDVQKGKLLKKLDQFHTIAVVLLEFSPSGKLLFSVGNDDKNKFAVYNWQSGAIIYSGPVSGGKVNGICWKNQTEYMTCGNDHVKFWQNGKGRQGKFKKDQIDSMFSCAYYQRANAYLTGSGHGKINVWKDNKAEFVKDAAHSGKIQTIVIKGQIIYTGGADGLINTWRFDNKNELIKDRMFYDSRSLSKLKQIKDIVPIQEQQFGILSIDFSQNQHAVIVTKGASVIYMQHNKQAKIIHQGHYKGQLWGLTTCKEGHYIVTGGDDKTVRLWDIQKKQQVRRVCLPNPVRAVDCQQNGSNKIVAGDFKAILYLFDKKLSSANETYKGAPFEENKNGTQMPWVEDIKFSPNSNKIIYGTHAKSKTIQIVSLNNDRFQSKALKFNGGTSALTHVDWSRNQQAVAINTQAWEYLFYSSTGQPMSASSLKDQAWNTYTRKYGFQSQGIFQDSDHTNINTICRDQQSKLLAVGYDDQTIRLFKYPCYIPKQVHRQYYGHSSHVTKIKFSTDNQRMISLGGLDRTIIVWAVQGGQQSQSFNKIKQEEDDGLNQLDQEIDLPAKLFRKKVKAQEPEDFHQVQNQGDQFMAIKPWLGAIKQPSYKYPNSNSKPPSATCELEYVFGYRAKDCRQNLFYRSDDTIVYHAAAVLIIHDVNRNTQQLFTEHNDDILSIDYHKQTDTILTGQLGPKPLVCLYKEGVFKHGFKSPVTKGVIAVSISPNGKLAVCVGIDENHTVAVLDLSGLKLLATEKSGKKVITKIKWRNNQQFVTVGINSYKEWVFQNSKLRKSEQNNQKANYVSLDISPQGTMKLAGGSNGKLYNFTKSRNPQQSTLMNFEAKKDKKQNPHVGVVECIKITDKFVACGTRNGIVVFLDRKDLMTKETVNIASVLAENKGQSQNACIRSIDFSEDKKKMLIGTLASEIYQFQIDQKFNINKDQDKIKIIMKAHYAPNTQWTNQVWGLCIPEQDNGYFFSCSDDTTIRCWDLKKRELFQCLSVAEEDASKNENYKSNSSQNSEEIVQIKAKAQLKDNVKLRAIGISPSGDFIVTGAKDGTVRIYHFNPKEFIRLVQVMQFKHAKQQISDIKFGYKTLVIGSHDNGIYIYDFDSQDYKQNQRTGLVCKKKFKPMFKHSSYITHLDISRDNCFLQSTCGAYELLFWDINSGKQITSGATLLKNQMWRTWTSNLGWPVQGIYPKAEDGTFINSVDRSNINLKGQTKYSQQPNNADCFLLAAGNDNGKVCIYNYPSLMKNSQFVEGKGHSSHVTTVRWTRDDSKIISTGGEDQCIMIWKVAKGKIKEENYNSKQKISEPASKRRGF